MSGIFIDRRLNGNGTRTADNRQKFIERIKGQVKDAVKGAVKKGNIKDLISDNGQTIVVPGKGLTKPEFRHGKGGITDRVLPGNKEFTTGDRLNKPKGGEGGGSGQGKSSADGEGEDEFQFTLTKEEFLDLLFEGLELPDLLKKQIAKVQEWKNKRVGYSTDGNPSQLSVIKTLSASKSRRVALKNDNTEKAKELKVQIAEIIKEINAAMDANVNFDDLSSKKETLELELKEVKKLIKHVPFIDDMDLRYNRWQKEAVPTSKAVFFCLMDVSGSMGQWEKEVAKKFFMILYLFLTTNYDSVDLVFIRYHTIAKEVSEEEFFRSTESGGTNASTAVVLMEKILNERYSSESYNIYASIATDGDDYMDDVPLFKATLNRLLPRCQYFPYIEIDRSKHKTSDLWPTLQQMSSQHKTLSMTKVHSDEDIYPVFRQLFEKKPKR